MRARLMRERQSFRAAAIESQDLWKEYLKLKKAYATPACKDILKSQVFVDEMDPCGSKQRAVELRMVISSPKLKIYRRKQFGKKNTEVT